MPKRGVNRNRGCKLLFLKGPKGGESESLPGEILDCDTSNVMTSPWSGSVASESLPGEILDCDLDAWGGTISLAQACQNHFQARYWIATCALSISLLPERTTVRITSRRDTGLRHGRSEFFEARLDLFVRITSRRDTGLRPIMTSFRVKICHGSESLPGEILDCDASEEAFPLFRDESTVRITSRRDTGLRPLQTRCRRLRPAPRQNHFQARYWIATVVLPSGELGDFGGSESLPGEILDCDNNARFPALWMLIQSQNHFQARYWIATRSWAVSPKEIEIEVRITSRRDTGLRQVPPLA